MMRRLQYEAPDIRCFMPLQYPRFGFLLSIPREQHGEIAVGKTANNGIQIQIDLPILVFAALFDHFLGRAQHLKRYTAAKIERITITQSLISNALRLDSLQILPIKF